MQIIKSQIGQFNGKYADAMNATHKYFAGNTDLPAEKIHACCIKMSNDLGRLFKETPSIISASGKLDKMTISSAMKEKNVASPYIQMFLLVCDISKFIKKWNTAIFPMPENMLSLIEGQEVELVDDSKASSKAA